MLLQAVGTSPPDCAYGLWLVIGVARTIVRREGPAGAAAAAPGAAARVSADTPLVGGGGAALQALAKSRPGRRPARRPRWPEALPPRIAIAFPPRNGHRSARPAVAPS